jgi:hypothetical protein
LEKRTARYLSLRWILGQLNEDTQPRTPQKPEYADTSIIIDCYFKKKFNPYHRRKFDIL